MIVFVVFNTICDYEFEAVFSTRENAEQYCYSSDLKAWLVIEEMEVDKRSVTLKE